MRTIYVAQFNVISSLDGNVYGLDTSDWTRECYESVAYKLTIRMQRRIYDVIYNGIPMAHPQTYIAYSYIQCSWHHWLLKFITRYSGWDRKTIVEYILCLQSAQRLFGFWRPLTKPMFTHMFIYDRLVSRKCFAFALCDCDCWKGGHGACACARNALTEHTWIIYFHSSHDVRIWGGAGNYYTISVRVDGMMQCDMRKRPSCFRRVLWCLVSACYINVQSRGMKFEIIPILRNTANGLRIQ